MKLLTVTAIALTMSTGSVALADTHMTGVDALYGMDRAQLIRTRDITGGEIYTMNEAYDEMSWGDNAWGSGRAYDAAGADWNNIGEIEDIVLDANGQMIGVVAEIGGFLDIGDKHVMIPVADISLVAIDDASYALVTRFNEEQLEELPGVDEGFWD